MLDGIWVPIEAETEGAKLPAALLQGTRLTIQGDSYAALITGQPDRGTFSIDPSKSPMAMDITGVEGPNAGRTIPAVYEIEGDRLRICYALGGPPRPSGFGAAAGTRHFLVTYRRVDP